jgi:site-specific DNA-methyltransferase (adenine-specific)
MPDPVSEHPESPEVVYEDEFVRLWHGDARVWLLGCASPDADAIVTDPPYGDTSLAWDQAVDGWLDTKVAPQLWCFGSMRFHLAQGHAFKEAGWTYGQEVVWEKHTGSGFNADRFRRVHELAVHWYRGTWSDLHRDVPTTKLYGTGEAKVVKRTAQPAHTGQIGQGPTYVSDGTRLERSVIKARSEHGRAVHPTQKPLGILRPLIQYSVPVGGLVLDPFAGSGSTLLAARETGRRAEGCEISAEYCEAAIKRLANLQLEVA